MRSHPDAPTVLFALAALATVVALRADVPTLVVDLLPGELSGVSALEVAELDGELIFAGSASAGAQPLLWRYDGSSPPTQIPGQVAAGAQPVDLTAWLGDLYFGSWSGGGIWRYDGSSPPVQVLVTVGFASSLVRFVDATATERLCFVGSTAATGTEVGCWDGVSPPVFADVAVGVTTSSPSPPVSHAGKLYFAATAVGGDRELYRFDGVTPPTLVADLRASGSSSPEALRSALGELYFLALDEAGTRRLWRYGGTNPPVLVSTTLLAAAGDLAASGGALQLFGVDDLAGPPSRIWSFDGSELRALPPASAQLYNLRAPAVHAGLLVFRAECGCSGSDLWVYCGESGPGLVTARFDDGVVVDGPVAALDRLFFVASVPGFGSELWQIDLSAPLCDDFEAGDTADWSQTLP